MSKGLSREFDRSKQGKVTCPKCQHKRRFRTLKGYSETYGICDRKNSCGYRKFPNGDEYKLTQPLTNQPKINFINLPLDKVSELSKGQDSNFHQFCKNSLGIPKDHLAKWKVGCNTKGETAFILSDKISNYNVKYIKYDASGKREKNINPRYEKAPKNSHYKRCLFGLHLMENHKITCLVESEKTAVICSFRFPSFNWLATGGSHALTSELAQSLKSSKVIYLPDADEAARNGKIPEILSRNGIQFKVIDLFPDQNNGYDLADAVIDGREVNLNMINDLWTGQLKLDDLFFKSKETTKLELAYFVKFLEQEGFIQRKVHSEIQFARVENNLVYPKSIGEIRDYFLNLIENDLDKYKAVIDSASRIFSNSNLECLAIKDLSYIKDTEKETYLFFKNGCLKINEEMCTLIPYSELNGVVDFNLVLDHEIELEDLENNSLEDFMFMRFIHLIAGKDPQRILSIATALGYLINNCIRTQKAVVLTDATMSENPEGRSGKTLLVKSLSKLRALTEIDAKTLKSNDRFRFQSVKTYTCIVALNDVSAKGSFSLEPFFTSISDGLVVEKKNKSPFTISCRMIFTSNRAIETLGGSAEDRVWEFELSNYFSKDHSPKDEFGCWFFEDWKYADWNKFYLVFATCAQQFHRHGLLSASPIYLVNRKIMDATTKDGDFLEFCDGIERNTYFFIKDLIAEFENRFPQAEMIDPRTFSKWLGVYCNYKKLEPVKFKSSGITKVLIREKGR